MSEYTDTRWKCDHCGRDVRKGQRQPSGWREAWGFYGVVAHCCPDAECATWLEKFCGENGYNHDEEAVK